MTDFLTGQPVCIGGSGSYHFFLRHPLFDLPFLQPRAHKHLLPFVHCLNTSWFSFMLREPVLFCFMRVVGDSVNEFKVVIEVNS